MKAAEQYFPVVLLYKRVLTFDTVDGILKRDRSNESYFPDVLFIMLYKMVLNFESVTWLKCYIVTIQMKAVLFCGTVCFSIFSKTKFS